MILTSIIYSNNYYIIRLNFVSTELNQIYVPHICLVLTLSYAFNTFNDFCQSCRTLSSSYL